MREMKDSGIEWIGEIPADWKVIKNKYLLSLLYSGGTPSVSNNDFYCVEGGTPFVSISDMSTVDYVLSTQKRLTDSGLKDKNLKILPIGTILYSIYATVGAVSELKIEAAISQAMLALQVNSKVDKSFYKYNLAAMKDYIFSNANGNTQFNLNAEKVKNFYFVLPNVATQRRIANYLDHKCSQIDAIIARQQEVIEKLKAYKLSVITEAVTKGLNPDVPMKDSGVEWIGEIPEHWDFRRIKNCCLIVDCKNRTPDPDPNGEYIVVRTTCIRDGSFSYEGSYHTNAENFKEWTAKGQPQHGDIFFTREAPMGEACLVPDADNLCMGQRVMFFRPLDGSDPRYILYSIYGPLAREYIDSKNKGSTVGHLKLGQVASLPLFYCPPQEQSEIANYLDRRCRAIDKVVDKKAEIVSRLANYKKSLIYEVVTGKKEV